MQIMKAPEFKDAMKALTAARKAMHTRKLKKAMTAMQKAMKAMNASMKASQIMKAVKARTTMKAEQWERQRRVQWERQRVQWERQRREQRQQWQHHYGSDVNTAAGICSTELDVPSDQ